MTVKDVWTTVAIALVSAVAGSWFGNMVFGHRFEHVSASVVFDWEENGNPKDYPISIYGAVNCKGRPCLWSPTLTVQCPTGETWRGRLREVTLQESEP